MLTVFVVPAIVVIVLRLANTHRAGRDCDQFVRWCFTAVLANWPLRLSLYLNQSMLANEDRRRFEMNQLVFNTHNNWPPGAFPMDG